MEALSPKQERFCQLIAEGCNQADAYRGAYRAGNMKQETIHQEESRLMANPNVAARVTAIRQPVIDELRYGLKEAMREAKEAFDVARDCQQGGAMVAATTLRSKLNGLLIDRKEIAGIGEFAVYDAQTKQEFRELLEAEAARRERLRQLPAPDIQDVVAKSST
jgi:phage terminase small subunit